MVVVVGRDVLSPQLDHAATRQVVGLVEDVADLSASIAGSDELGDESVVEFAAEGLVPFWRGGRHLLQLAGQL